MKSIVTVLLDKSSSMGQKVSVDSTDICKMVPFKDFLVKAVNKFIEDLIKSGEFEYNILTFNTVIEYLCENMSSKDFISIGEYMTSGNTAFYDSVGKVIKDQINHKKEKGIEIKNILLVITDGYDNSSTTMSCLDLKDLITKVEKNHNFKVILLGTEINTHSLGNNIGLCPQTSASFDKTEEGINNIMAEVSYSVGRCITEGDIKDLKINSSIERPTGNTDDDTISSIFPVGRGDISRSLTVDCSNEFHIIPPPYPPVLKK